ncbi:hypothetical protein ACFYRD_38810 [Streptomyces hirsutus]|uniref:hypothetical protein n=1 Tax=Streptomyces hirsutus TaxID=35620 RepID=UPI0036AC476A
MANLADEYGTDVEIYIKALTTIIHADTPTGAPAGLHDLLEQLGLERHEYPTGEPLYIWHTVPEHLEADEQKRLRTTPSPPCSWPDTQSTATPTSLMRPSTSRPRTKS